MNYNNTQQFPPQTTPLTHPINPQLMNHIHNIVKHAMQSFWNISNPSDIQINVTSNLLIMNMNKIPPNPILMVQPTGSGKSLIPLTFGTIAKGVVLVIENTLSLASDQCNRIKRVNQFQGHAVSSIHLNNIRTTSQKQSISKYLSEIKPTTNTTIFLYSSPDLIHHKDWQTPITTMIKNKVIRLICIDEVHQFDIISERG